MHMLKKISFWFAFSLLNTALLLALVVTPVSTHLTNRESIKSWVSNPEVLDGVSEVVPTILSDAFEGDGNEVGLTQVSEQIIGVNLNELADASSDILTPEYITQKLYPVIDGVYDWLEGKTDSPEFNVVLSDKLTALADAVGGPLKSELAKLPACPSNLVYTPDFNPIEALCVPPGTDVNFIVDEFTRQITTSPDIADISFSSDDMEFDEELLTTAPLVYSGASNLPYVFAGVALLFSVAVVLLSKSTRHGLRNLSWIYIGNGLLVALSFWILGNTDAFVNINSAEGISPVVADNLIEPFIKIVLSDIARTGLLISLSVAAIGAAILLALYTHHKIAHEQDENSKKTTKAKKETPAPTSRQEARYLNKIAKK